MQSLTYFVELPSPEVEALFCRPGIIEGLLRSRAAVSMALLDLGPGQARVIRRLNAQGVGVTAWLVLEQAEGYWLTADNAHLACRRYEQVRRWAGIEELVFEAVGLDMELPYGDCQALVQKGPRALGRLLLRRRSPQALRQAAARYAELVQQIRSDGLRVETYHLPLLLDDRRAGSSLVQRILGLVDLPADREVVMLYRSAVPGVLGTALVDAYGPEAQAIGVGITGGGVQLLAPLVAPRRLDLPALLLELRRARRYTDCLYVFSLEGCVQAGFFEALCRTDLFGAAPPSRLAGLGRLARGSLRATLKLAGVGGDLFRGRSGPAGRPG